MNYRLNRRRKRVLHHGSPCNGEFEPKYWGTDYFAFVHIPCRENLKEHKGTSHITKVLVDNQGRIVFNLKCRDCGTINALKTHPHFFRHPGPEEGFEPLDKIIQLATRYKQCAKYHWWNNV